MGKIMSFWKRKNSSRWLNNTGKVRKISYIRDRLLFKINIPIAVVLSIGISVWSYFHIDFQGRMQTRNIISKSELMCNTIRFNLNHFMMTDAREGIKNIVSEYATSRDIRSIRILNKIGDIKYATDTRQVGDSVQLTDTICQVCHSQPEPIANPTSEQRVYQEDNKGGEHIIHLVTPVRSEPRCATAPCHYHLSEEKLLGFIDLSFSRQSDDELARDIRRNAVFQAVTLFIATFITIFILFFVLIKKPIGKIRNDASTLAEGHATRNSNAGLTDEIGQLSEAVHKMGHDLIGKQTELILQKNLYQDLFEGVPCLVTVQDRNYKLLRFNRTFAEHFNANIGDFCYVAYKSRSEPCENCPVKDTLADGRSRTTEETGYYKDGTKAQWIVTTAPIYDDKGEAVAAMEMCLDITSRKVLEEMLRKSRQMYLDIFNHIKSAVFVIDKEDLTIIDCNASALKLYGTNKEELLGRPLNQLFADDGQTGNRKPGAIQAVLAAGGLDQTKHVTIGGREFFVSLQATPMQFDERGVLLVSTVDITERLKAEQQLIQAGKMATLGEMATAVAHELNQPLAVIQTSIDLLSRKIQRHETPAGDELERVNELMARCIDRAINIIDHMRSFGRKSGVDPVLVSVNEILRRAFAFFDQQLAIRNIEVEWHLDENQLLVNGKPNRLEQIIINLFTNARDAIEERATRNKSATEKRITIRSFLENSEVVVEFSDTGVGIPPRYRDKVFEPYFTTKEVGKGTGIGLAISYNIVKEHGGRIDVTENDSGGVTFKIRLPAASI